MDHHHCWQKGATDFVTYYDGLCSLQSTYPVASIRGCAEVGVLNCQMNRIKRADWNPILTALRANRTLHTVVFHYKWEEKAQMFFNDETCRARIPLRLVNKTADVEIINDIIRAVKIFISHSQSVTSLILEGLTLTLSNIKLLSKGLKKNQSLKHLSLKGTGISDKGFIILSQVLKHCYTMEWLDLTWCNLTTASIIVIADMIRYQAIHRQSSIWKDSLRGYAPVHSSISGLKRITLNLNPQIKDSGAMKLAESLEDDVWIKALDMQSCGLTSMTAQLFVMVLQNNSTLQIADLRENELIDDNELDLLNKELANRGVAKEFNESYEWLDVELTRIKRELRTAGVPLYKKNAKSHPVMVQASSSSIKWQNTKRKGMPWRTAARSSQRWKNLISQRVSLEVIIVIPNHYYYRIVIGLETYCK
jgi:centrosomal protein CEP78